MNILVQNTLAIKHGDPSKIQEVIAAYRKGSLLSYLRPEPDYARNFRSQNIQRDPTAEHELPLHLVVGIIPPWYQWRCDNWDTPYDIVETDFHDYSKFKCKILTCECCGDTEAELDFLTENAPPLSAYRSARTELGFSLEATYSEFSLGFAGRYSFNVDGEKHIRFTGTKLRKALAA